MKRILLPAAVIAVTIFSTYGQTQSPQPGNSACSLTIAQSPAIRGVKLGMNTDDVLAMFPGSTENHQIKSSIEKADVYPNFGIMQIYITPARYSTKDRFRGIEAYRLTSVDSRIAMYEVNYSPLPDGPTWHSVDDFIAKIAESFRLPSGDDWASDQYSRLKKTLKCDGFQLEASILNFQGSLTVATTDPPFKTQQQRREALEEKIRREFKP